MLCPLLEPRTQSSLTGTFVARQRGNHLVVRRQFGERDSPRRTAVAHRDGNGNIIGARTLMIFLETLKKMPPLVGYGSGITLVLFLHLLDVGGIRALQE